MLWPLLLLLGIEQVRIVPGLFPVSPFDFTSYPYSHSLVAQIGWGALLGFIYFMVRRNVSSALLVGLLVPSHWLLDFIAHRPDMPIYPGGAMYGLGMWNSLLLTIVVEYVLFVAGAAVYLSVTRAKDRTGNLALWSLLGLLAVLYPRFYLWTSAPERAGARLERSRHLAHRAVGSVGRPASAIKHGEFVNFELTANGLMILVAQTSVCALFPLPLGPNQNRTD